MAETRSISRVLLAFIGVFLGVGALAPHGVEGGSRKLTTIAVLGFDDRSGNGAENVAATANEMLSVALARSRTFQVVEREKLDLVLREQELILSGAVDLSGDIIVRLGKLLGARYIVTGSVVQFDLSERRFNGYGVQTVSTKVTLGLTVKLLDTNTGAVAYADQVEKSKWYHEQTPQQIIRGDGARTLLKEVLWAVVDQLIYFETGEAGGRAGQLRVPISTVPPGADIEIDGNYVGATPMSVDLSTDTQHEVRLSLAGFGVWERRVKPFKGLKIQVHLIPPGPP